MRGKVLIFKKLQKPEIEYFSENLLILSYNFKEKLPKGKFGIRFCVIFFLGPQNRQNCFCPCWKQKLFLFSFFSVYAVKQAKERILFQVQPLRVLNK